MSTMLNSNAVMIEKLKEDEYNKVFRKEPRLNVISKEIFERRTTEVFTLLWETLSKSFGPYGAPTIICNYPNKHVTKDGFTIMKHLSLDASDTLIDQSIADLVADICGRLNYTVGDGTTTATIATHAIYKAYQKYKKDLEDLFILPRDVIARYNVIKEKLVSDLQYQIEPINTLDLDELAKNIEKVVYISSNGDSEITGYISNFYKELGNPAISSTLSPDGVTRAISIKGYSFELMLMDQMYINNDSRTMELREADIVIFSIKITKTIYEEILKPLNYESQARGRHLIVCAPSYDETTLMQTIRQELKKEYKAHGDVNMILTTYRSFREDHRKLIADFAVLMDTDIIDRSIVTNMLDKLSSGMQIFQVFNIDSRNIEGLTCKAVTEDFSKSVSYQYGVDTERLHKNHLKNINEFDNLTLTPDCVRLGYTRDCSLGLKKSLFTNLVYNESLYRSQLDLARRDLEDAQEKYKRLGTFNIEVAQAQKRYYALTLKTGIIEVGASSELAQGLLKDAVDDSVKAAESAFNHGVILGCNVTLLKVIYNYLERLNVVEETDNLRRREQRVVDILMRILFDGFFDVYKTVLTNTMPDVSIDFDIFTKTTEQPIGYDDFREYYDMNIFIDYINEKIFKNSFGYANAYDIFDDKNILNTVFDYYRNRYNKVSITFFDTIILYSILSDSVFDITKFIYSKDIINSSQTDVEVLNATIDLITLLITGNQMLVTQKQHYNDNY